MARLDRLDGDVRLASTSLRAGATRARLALAKIKPCQVSVGVRPRRGCTRSRSAPVELGQTYGGFDQTLAELGHVSGELGRVRLDKVLKVCFCCKLVFVGHVARPGSMIFLGCRGSYVRSGTWIACPSIANCHVARAELVCPTCFEFRSWCRVVLQVFYQSSREGLCQHLFDHGVVVSSGLSSCASSTELGIPVQSGSTRRAS